MSLDTQLPVEFVLALRSVIFDRHEDTAGLVTYTVKPISLRLNGHGLINYQTVAEKTWACHGVCLHCGKKFFKARCKTCGVDYDSEKRGWHGEVAELDVQYEIALEFMCNEGFWERSTEASASDAGCCKSE